jgi:DNA-binding transcriptional MerR regulator
MLRVKDVTARTGLSRQAIHFYVQQGLVDPPHKTGKTMAYYTEAHVERILLVRKLQDEQFLPLKAIHALLADGKRNLSVPQRRTLAEIKTRLPAATTTVAAGTVALAPLVRRTGVTQREVAELARAGLIRVVGGRVPADQVWIVELWGEVIAAGLTREHGVTPALLVRFDAAIERVFRDEKAVLTRMTRMLPPARVAEMIERALPLVHAFLVRVHQAKVRALFATALEPS